MQDESRLRINLVGFIIDIYFHPAENVPTKEAFVRGLKDYLNNFIIRQFEGKANYSIHVVERVSLQLYSQGANNTVYIPILERYNNSSLRTFYYISITQFQVILKKALSKLLNGKGFVLHASALEKEGSVLVFTGKEGVGKSTICQLLKPHGFRFVADDTVYIRIVRKGFFAYSTPFIERVQMEVFEYPIPVAHLFFLHHSGKFYTSILTSINQKIRLATKQLRVESPKNISMLVKFANEIPMKHFYFSKDSNLTYKLLQETTGLYLDE